jgi:uncharacterized protein (DUF1778 family)
MTEKPEQRRTRFADIRVMTTPTERKELQKAADAAGLALSTFVRVIAIAAVRRGETVIGAKAV